MDNGVNDEGDGKINDNDYNGDGATDCNGATVQRCDNGDGNGATDDDDDDDNNGNDDSDGAADNDDGVNDDDDVNDVDNNSLPPPIGKRNGCDETKTEEEEMVADSVVIHTTIKQIMGRGG
jgi:hypothetical protein